MGGVAFGIIVAAIGVFAFIRYKRAKLSRPPLADLDDDQGQDGPPPHWRELPQDGIMELQDNAVHEMSEEHREREGTKEGISELPENQMIGE